MGFSWVNYVPFKGETLLISDALIKEIQDNADSLDNGKCIAYNYPTSGNDAYDGTILYNNNSGKNTGV